MPRKKVTATATLALIPTRLVAKELGVHPETIKKAIRAGQLKAYELGNGYQTTREWLNEYLEKKMVSPVPEPVEIK